MGSLILGFLQKNTRLKKLIVKIDIKIDTVFITA